VCSVRTKVRQFHSLRARLQHGEDYCLLKVWIASYRCSLIYGQAADLACSVTVEYQREALTCICTGGHAVDLNCRVVEEVVTVMSWQNSEARFKHFRDS
jgi:hypothetical protein